MQNSLLEACVETYGQAILAEERGAHRIELCAQLEHGGLTPDPELVKVLLQILKIPIKVMVRPRPGDFVYSADEIAQMAEEISLFKEMGISEIVLGVLDENGSVYIEQLEYLAEIASPMAITFHKAIDETADPLSELERMTSLPQNINAILTSGKQPTAQQGHALLKAMVKRFHHRFTIIAAGKVTDENVMKLHQLIGAREYHGRRIVGDLGGSFRGE
jgi:copper homeostasis protein